ncbi:unnamed protein product, partial [marine sediment metagenome]
EVTGWEVCLWLIRRALENVLCLWVGAGRPIAGA